MSYRRYYITPTRLVRNPFLWRSIGLITTMKPDQEIFLPEATVSWLRTGWHTISVENAVLCIQHAEHDLYYDWKANIPIAQRILDQLLFNTPLDLKRIPLECTYTKEESIVKFLETECKVLSVKKGIEPSALRTGISVSDYLLRNPSIKTYQIEMLWDYFKCEELMRQVVYRTPLDKIPDYILTALLDSTSALERNYTQGSALFSLYKEGIRREMLVRREPTTAIVGSQSRPTIFVNSWITSTEPKVVV